MMSLSGAPLRPAIAWPRWHRGAVLPRYSRDHLVSAIHYAGQVSDLQLYVDVWLTLGSGCAGSALFNRDRGSDVLTANV